MKKRVLYWGVLLCLNLTMGYGQEGPALPSVAPSTPEAAALGKFIDVPVSHYTGVPQIGVPLCAVAEPGISIPISLSYHASGIKVDEIASRVGLGWAISGQGTVTRSVRGIPDDYQGTGFLNTSITVAAFQAASGQQQGSWTLQANQSGALDFESDVYYFNLPGGASGKFFFRQDGTPIIMPHNQDIKIVPIQNASGHLVKWEISLANGLKYYLGRSKNDAQEAVNRTTTNTFTMQDDGTTSFPFTPAHFENYVTTWHLIEIETPYNDVITYEYEAGTISTSTVSFSGERESLWYQAQEQNCELAIGTASYSQINNTVKRLHRIVGENTTVEFTYGQSRLDLIHDAALTKLSVFNNQSTLVKEYSFTYDYFTSTATHANPISFGDTNQRNKRLYLKDVEQTFAGATNQKYSFEYDTTYILPDRLSFSTDFWGYYNGKNNTTTHIPAVEAFAQGTFFDRPGADRKVAIAYAKACSLKKIIYPTGGSASYAFESHTVTGGNAFFAATAYNLETIAQVNTTGDNTQFIEVPFTITNSPGNFNFPAQGLVDYSLQMYNDQGQSIALCDPSQFDCPNISVWTASNTHIADITTGSGTIPIVNDGSYKLRVENYSADFGGKIDVVVSLSGRRQLDPSSPNATFGGLRIKDITLEDVSGVQLLKKIYTYNRFDNTSLSSGTALNPPTFLWDGLAYASNGCGAAVSVEVSSNPIFPLDNEGNYSVGYANVTEAFEGNQTGKTEYTFHIEPLGEGDQTNIYDANSITGHSDLYPNTPLHDFSHLRGLLLAQVHYKLNADQSFSVLQKSTNDYHYRVTSENILEENIAMASRGLLYFSNDYTNFSERFYMDRQISTTFFYNASNVLVDSLSQTTEYFYDSFPTHNQLTSTITTNSDGTTAKVTTKYPEDIASITGLDATQTAAINRLRSGDLYRLGMPIEVITYENTKKLSTQRTIYKDWGNDLLLPELIQTAKSADGLEDRLEYTQYDSEGNILEVRQSNGSYITYLWGYNQMYPVAKIDNARLSEVATALGVTTQSLITNGVTNLSTLNSLRGNLSGALVTTYTHKPLVGVISMTDPSGYTMSYEYDDFNRLIRIKDADGHIVSENQYHYKGQ